MFIVNITTDYHHEHRHDDCILLSLENQQDTVKVIHPTNLFPRPTTAGPEAWWQIRLPRDIVPVHYNVFLNVTPDLPRFDGNVEIVVNVTSSTDLILVHISGLNISHVTLVSQAKLEGESNTYC